MPADSAVIIGKTWQESTSLRETNPDKLVFTAGDLLLTAQDVSGEIRSVQSIQENGRKRFAAGGAKQDTFHVVGGQGLEALEKAPVSFSEDDCTFYWPRHAMCVGLLIMR